MGVRLKLGVGDPLRGLSFGSRKLTLTGDRWIAAFTDVTNCESDLFSRSVQSIFLFYPLDRIRFRIVLIAKLTISGRSFFQMFV
ncbi:hypothetical protein [Microcoleus sp. F4-D5]|uniref:hypothetical protein n=1 Tax=Microcoleus sp. F4-D5 TaxID=2818760 RepID=UPI002FCF3972